MPVVTLISLGCAKNTVDSECILGRLMAAGLLIAENPADADVCLVNTCGFIQDARQETHDTLRELASLKRRGRLKAVVALGCLVERTADCPEMNAFLADADARVGFRSYPDLPDICHKLAEADSPRDAQTDRHRVQSESFLAFLKTPRARIGSTHTAYLKIAEGCSNRCRFCSIPLIRGPQLSRRMEDILKEAEQLAHSGAREINIIAQDTTRYGLDLYKRLALPELLLRLKEIDPSVWFRFLYAHPRHLTDELIDTLASEPHLCPYIDMPLQHIADPILDAMGRGFSRKDTLELLNRIKRKMPDVALRTAFIVGFPGERGQDYSELFDFVKEGWFDHVGVFTYSREPGTGAAKLADNVPEAEKTRRRDELMLAQLDVSRKRLKRRIGQRMEVMLDGFVQGGRGPTKGVTAYGRSRREAPEVDGVVLLKGKGLSRMKLGTLLEVVVTDAMDYDLIAKPIA